MQYLKNNRKAVTILLPIAVVAPLVLVSWLIGPTSILFWIGIGLVMIWGWKHK
jgi:hypothetical protein